MVLGVCGVFLLGMVCGWGLGRMGGSFVFRWGGDKLYAVKNSLWDVC
jgi:hypothetical protein